jgi:hypothetical protein
MQDTPKITQWHRAQRILQMRGVCAHASMMAALQRLQIVQQRCQH